LKRDIRDQISAIRRQERKEEVWESKVERNSRRKFTQRLAEKRDGNTEGTEARREKNRAEKSGVGRAGRRVN
jgi:hypothetical protein